MAAIYKEGGVMRVALGLRGTRSAGVSRRSVLVGVGAVAALDVDTQAAAIMARS